MPHIDHPIARKTGRAVAAPVSFKAHEAWPEDALSSFTLRMAGHGFCISRMLMINDRRYALEQLAHAHTLADDALRELTTELFRHFERQRSGLAHLSYTALY